MSAVSPEQVLPAGESHVPSGAAGILHRKGTTSAFFLNAEVALSDHDTASGGLFSRASCHRRLCAQVVAAECTCRTLLTAVCMKVYDVASANAVGQGPGCVLSWADPWLAEKSFEHRSTESS